MEIQEIAKQIKLVILDVDGVLSDGCINISGDGELLKSFFVRDGLGIKFLQDAGIAVAISYWPHFRYRRRKGKRARHQARHAGRKRQTGRFYQHLHTSQC